MTQTLPGPTRQPPSLPYPPAPGQEQAPEANAEKKVAMTPSRGRLGQTPLARAVKAIIRPFFKVLYYLIQWMRTHKLATLIALVLLAASIILTTYVTTGAMPFSSNASDNTGPAIQNSAQLAPSIQSWLLALRAGDLTGMETAQKTIPTSVLSPDAGAYIELYSEKYGGMTWTSEKVTSISTAPDGTVDTFIEVDMTAPAASGSTPAKLIVLWHFTTIPQLQNSIARIDFVSARQSLA